MVPICGYEGKYSVDERGNIYSHLTDKYLKPNMDYRGYCSVELFGDRSRKRVLVHRLVASAFIPNPRELPFVNHKDENPSNNDVSNLEWCTAKYNQNYGTVKERRKQTMINGYWSTEKRHLDALKSGQRTKEILGRVVLQIAKNGEVVRQYISVNEATRQTKIRHIHEV